jgi:hypothetical protein
MLLPLHLLVKALSPADDEMIMQVDLVHAVYVFV